MFVILKYLLVWKFHIVLYCIFVKNIFDSVMCGMEAFRQFSGMF